MASVLCRRAAADQQIRDTSQRTMLALLCGTVAVPVERAEGSADRHEDRELVTGPIHAWTLNPLTDTDSVSDGDRTPFPSRGTSLLNILHRHSSRARLYQRPRDPIDNALGLRWDENEIASFVDDHSWADVERWGTNLCAVHPCTPKDKMDGPRDLENCIGDPHLALGFSEGLGGGLPGDCGKEYLSAGEWQHTQLFDQGKVWFQNGMGDELAADLNYTRGWGADLASDCNASKVKLNYGCWFTIMSKGAGVYTGASVNVGKSLRVKGRGAAAKALGLPCSNFPLCDYANQPLDKLWCHAAQKLGYDSIQIRSIEDDQHAAELVMCKGCGEAALNGACPPLDLRRGSWDQRPGSCECDDSADRLNCGDSTDFAYCQMEAGAWANRTFRNKYDKGGSYKKLIAGPAIREYDSRGVAVAEFPGRWVTPITFVTMYGHESLWVVLVGAPWGVFTSGKPQRIEGGVDAVRAAYNDDTFVRAMLAYVPEDFTELPGSQG